MIISHFSKIRLDSEGHGDGVFVDIKAFPDGCSSGFMITGYDIPSYKNSFARHKVEVRKKLNQTALFVYKYDDSEIDEWWKDAEILYTWTQPGKDDEQ